MIPDLVRRPRGLSVPLVSRVIARLIAAAALGGLACRADAAAGPTLPTVTTADVAAVQQAIALIGSLIADPALASARTVSLPFNLVGAADAGVGAVAPGGRRAPLFALVLRRTSRIARALTRVNTLRSVNLGDFDIPPGFYGGTFVRLGSYFRRDTTLRGAPAKGVRVVLYQRDANGFSTATQSGFIEVIDQNRGGPEFITTARVIASDSVTVAAVSANRHYEPSSGLYNVFDILSGTMGRGTPAPIVIVDSLIDYYGLTATTEFEAVITTVPAAGISMRATFPADSTSDVTSFQFTIVVGGQTVRIKGIPFSGSSHYDLTVSVGGQYAGNVSSANILTLGDSARMSSGARLPEPLRSYINAIGALIDVAPVAAQVSTSAATLLLILDGTPLP